MSATHQVCCSRSQTVMYVWQTSCQTIEGAGKCSQLSGSTTHVVSSLNSITAGSGKIICNRMFTLMWHQKFSVVRVWLWSNFGWFERTSSLFYMCRLKAQVLCLCLTSSRTSTYELNLNMALGPGPGPCFSTAPARLRLCFICGESRMRKSRLSTPHSLLFCYNAHMLHGC